MKKNIYVIIFFCFLSGIVWFLYQKSWLIIQFPTTAQSTKNTDTTTCTKINIYFWLHNQWNKESIEMIFCPDMQANSLNLINHFLLCCRQAGITDKAIQLQSAILTKSNDLIISFNQNPFGPQASSLQKLHFLKSLLKTLKELPLKINRVQLLVNHKPIIDDHLNFDIFWLIDTKI